MKVGAKQRKTLDLCGFSWYYTYAGKLDVGQVHRAIGNSFAKFPAVTNSKTKLALTYRAIRVTVRTKAQFQESLLERQLDSQFPKEERMQVSVSGHTGQPATTLATSIERCPTNKKCFVSREAAEKFEEEIHRKYPEQVRQYVYACEDCPNWHLTTQSPESRALARSSIRPIECVQPARYADKREEVCKLKRQGMLLSDIATRTGVPYQTVRNICIEAGLHVVERQGNTVLKAASTVESISQQEQALEAQLRELQAKKQRLIEENALKLVPCFDGKGVVIKKRIESLSLSFADAEELVEKMVDYLSEHNKVENKETHEQEKQS